MSESPRVNRLVMYKHGLAPVKRSGPVSGDGEKIRQLRDGAEGQRRAAWDELQRLIGG